MFAELVNHLWQSTLFGLGAAAVALLLHRERANVRYWIWWAASVKFLVPFAWLVAAGNALAPNVPALVVEDWPATLETFAQPLASERSWTPVLVALAGIWGAGFLLMAHRLFTGAWRIRSIVRVATPCQELALGSAMPRVLWSRAQIEPALVGVLRPALLLPRGLRERLTHAQLAAVVAHELCHWRRRDNLTAAVHMLVAALFWFHPLVWWIGRRLADERERACDEAVVAAGHDPAVYAAAILDVCAHYFASPLECAPGVGGGDLKRRVVEIVQVAAFRQRLNAAKKTVLAIAAGLSFAAPVAIGMLNGNLALAQEGDIAIAEEGSDSLPLVRIAPNYPPEALAANLEGVVTLEFTIATDGRTADIRVVESTSPVFEQPAITALSRWRYAPIVRDDRPVALPGVHTRIAFRLERDAQGEEGGPGAALRIGDQELLNVALGAYTPQEMALPAFAAAAPERAVPVID